jgi:hypothetical protein
VSGKPDDLSILRLPQGLLEAEPVNQLPKNSASERASLGSEASAITRTIGSVLLART